MAKLQNSKKVPHDSAFSKQIPFHFSSPSRNIVEWAPDDIWEKMGALDGRAKQGFAVFWGGQRNHELKVLEVPESIVCNNPNTGRMLFEKPK